MKTFFLFIATNLLLSISYVYAQDNNKMTILNHQPVFEINIEGFGAQYLIELNGVTIFRQYNSRGKIETTIPVNHYMRSGKNKLAIISWPDHGVSTVNMHGYVKADLQVSEHEKTDVSFSITTLDLNNKSESEIEKVENSSLAGVYNSNNEFKADDSGDVIVGEVVTSQSGNIFEYQREFKIPSSLPLWAFFTSDELPNTDAMSDEDYYQSIDVLLIEYLKVQNAIAGNNTDEVLAMFEERNRELDTAFYNPPGTLQSKIKEALTNAAIDSKAELAPLSSNMLNFSTNRGNKLVKLIRSEHMPAISLNYKEIQGSYSFDLIFRLQDGKWILTR